MTNQETQIVGVTLIILESMRENKIQNLKRSYCDWSWHLEFRQYLHPDTPAALQTLPLKLNILMLNKTILSGELLQPSLTRFFLEWEICKAIALLYRTNITVRNDF